MTTAAAPEIQPADPLVVCDVSVRFGGLKALTGVSISVCDREIVGLIGSNGAGKTTLMDCISGFVEPAKGSSIKVFGQEVCGMPPERRAYAEVGRSFQDARLFPSLTVEGVFLVALERHHPTSTIAALLRLPTGRSAEVTKRAWLDELIAMSGLSAFRDNLIGELSTGTRRVVDLMCQVAQGSRLLLLDEPSAGIAQAETEALAPLLLRLQDQLECGVLIIEHDMPLISQLCNRVYALEAGSVIAEGPPAEVLKTPRVIASYLGTDNAAILRSGSRSRADPVPAKRRSRSKPLAATSKQKTPRQKPR